MPIDIHAHYVPPQLIDAIAARGKDIGVQLVQSGGAPPALHFDYGFKVRPFFPRLVEPVGERLAWLDQQGIDVQIVGTWPDIFGYGLAADACIAWHRMLNDTLAAWCADNADRFAWIGSVPLIQPEAAAHELERAGGLGACGVIISSNIENINIGELPLDPFWRKAEALGMPVLIHPVLVGPAPRAAKFGLAQVVQYTFDTTLGIGSVLMSGVLDRFPGSSWCCRTAEVRTPISPVVSTSCIGAWTGPRRAMSRPSCHRPMPRRWPTTASCTRPKPCAFSSTWPGLIMWCWGLIIRSRRPIWSRSRTCVRPRLSAAEIDAIADANPRRVFARLR